MSAICPRQFFALDEACKPLLEAFRTPPYLVGTAADKKPYNDVDVRMILDDEQFDAMRSAIGENAMMFIAFAIGDQISARTGLPIDFQFQRHTEANAKHTGTRNALGIRNLNSYKGDAA